MQRLAAGVWLLELGWMPPLGANAYLADDGDAVTLVDAGLPLNATPIADELAATGHAPGDIDRVLLTHYDVDHVGGLARLTPALDAPVYLGADDAALLSGETDPPWLHHKGAFHRLVRPFFSIPDGLTVVSVADGDDIGGFEAYHAPGHNPGHTVYVHDDLGVAFLGDLVWSDDDGLTPPIRFDSYDMDGVRDSIRAVAERAPAVEMACMGHGDPLSTGGHAALARLAATLG